MKRVADRNFGLLGRSHMLCQFGNGKAKKGPDFKISIFQNPGGPLKLLGTFQLTAAQLVKQHRGFANPFKQLN